MQNNSPKHERNKEIVGTFKNETETVMASGVVTDCRKLNIRKEPDPNADVISVIPVSTEVIIDVEASTDDFYKVCIAAGVEGFCMKKYIAIRK